MENMTASFPTYSLLQDVENVKFPAVKKNYILEHCEKLTLAFDCYILEDA